MAYPYYSSGINPYFPASYQPILPQVPPTQMYQPPYPVQPTAQPAPVQQPAQPQPMTPPTIHAEIIQVRTAEEVETYPMNVGTVQMFQIGDGSAFATKEVYANGQYNVDLYVKQPKKPVANTFDPSVFVTKEELESRLASLTRPRRKATETEVPNNGESV